MYLKPFSEIYFIVRRLELILKSRKIKFKPRAKSSLLKGKFKLKGKKIRVLFFSHNLSLEGASISLFELVNGLEKNTNINAKVISFKDGPLKQKYKKNKINVEILDNPIKKVFENERFEEEINNIAALIKFEEPDLVFVNTFVNYFVLIAAEKAGLPSILNPRESEDWKLLFKYLPYVLKVKALESLGLPQKYIFVSKNTLKKWNYLNKKNNFKLIRNKLDKRRFYKANKDNISEIRDNLNFCAKEHVFLSVGTLCQRKNQLLILKALLEVSKHKVSPIRVVFVGKSNSLYGFIMKLYSIKFLFNNSIIIKFINPTQNIANYYLASDTFLFTSKLESCPRVILESIFFKIPLIASRIPYVEEITKEYSEILFFKSNDILALSKQILKRVKTNYIKSKINFNNDSFENMVEDYRKVISEIFI
tara:strand:+ start:19312 stop:20574 length:1263 start_codon:yes stop_codon:yes gene_type:complete